MAGERVVGPGSSGPGGRCAVCDGAGCGMTGPLVVKLGGAALDEPRERGDLWRALAEAHATSGAGVVLVHGGGKAVDAHLARLGLETIRRDGIRLTPAEQVGEITAVLAGRMNKALVGALVAAGAPAAGLCLGDGRAVETVKTNRYGFDAGQVGEIAGGDGRILRVLLDAGYLPVLSSIGIDEGGELLNINADDAAVGVARALGASALVLLTDVPGILGPDGRVVAEATSASVEAMIAKGTISGGMIPKARAAVEAAEKSGTTAVIASFNDACGLAALARGERTGTRIAPMADAATGSHTR